MGRSEEDRAFRRLKNIEWRLAYTERERRWVAKQIKWANSPKMSVLFAFLAVVATYLMVMWLQYTDTGSSPVVVLDAGCLSGLIILFLITAVFLWATRETRDEALTERKRAMELKTEELKAEREEIYREYPQLKGREVGMVIPVDKYRILEVIVFLIVLGIVGVYHVMWPEKLTGSTSFLFIYLIYFSWFMLEGSRLKQYGVNIYKRRKKRKSIPVETEERFDILEYKRF